VFEFFVNFLLEVKVTRQVFYQVGKEHAFSVFVLLVFNLVFLNIVPLVKELLVHRHVRLAEVKQPRAVQKEFHGETQELQSRCGLF
jgi:hypothetical protein